MVRASPGSRRCRARRPGTAGAAVTGQRPAGGDPRRRCAETSRAIPPRRRHRRSLASGSRPRQQAQANQFISRGVLAFGLRVAEEQLGRWSPKLTIPSAPARADQQPGRCRPLISQQPVRAERWPKPRRPASTAASPPLGGGDHQFWLSRRCRRQAVLAEAGRRFVQLEQFTDGPHRSKAPPPADAVAPPAEKHLAAAQAGVVSRTTRTSFFTLGQGGASRNSSRARRHRQDARQRLGRTVPQQDFPSTAPSPVQQHRGALRGAALLTRPARSLNR